MKNDRVTRASKSLSWLLRHAASEKRLAMDAEGFAQIADVLRILRIRRDELDDAVRDNNKKRFEVVGDKIRAVQGHSDPVVDLRALEATWLEYVHDARVFHGTSADAAEAILGGDGINAGARSHVHLAATIDAKVGKRAGVAVLLVVDPAKLRMLGEQLFQAPNGVLLARRVPRGAIVDVLPAGSRAPARSVAPTAAEQKATRLVAALRSMYFTD